MNVVYDAFEHWKELVKLSCLSEEALITHKDYFKSFISKFIITGNKINNEAIFFFFSFLHSCAAFSTERNP